jgi:hypothetical protein
VDGAGISVHGWGEQYGAGIADGENKDVMKNITEALPSFSDSPIDDNEMAKAVDEVLLRLDTTAYDPIILIIDSWSASRTLESSDAFSRPDTIERKPRLLGYYKKKPMFRLYVRLKPAIVIVDIKKLAVWKQFKPKLTLDGERYISDEFALYVKEYSRDSAQALMAKQPHLLIDKATGQPRPEEEVLNEFQQRVHFRIVEQYEFEILDRNAGYVIPAEERD